MKNTVKAIGGFLAAFLIFTLAGCNTANLEPTDKSKSGESGDEVATYSVTQTTDEGKTNYQSNEQINRFGNTVGNLNNNHGIATAQGDWIYYTTNTGIYKVKNNGKSETLLSTYDALSLSVSGNWLYFRKAGTGDFYKITTDGNNTQLFLSGISDLVIANGYIYYTKAENGFLYRMNPDKTNNTLLLARNCSHNLNITHDSVYWGDNIDLYVANLDGSNIRMYEDSFSQALVIEDGYKYTSGNLCKAKIDGSNKKQLDGPGAMDHTLKDGWVYYLLMGEKGGYGGNIYKIRTDGSGRTKLKDGECFNICAVGDWIFYMENNGSSMSDYRKIKTDGSEDTLLQ